MVVDADTANPPENADNGPQNAPDQNTVLLRPQRPPLEAVRPQITRQQIQDAAARIRARVDNLNNLAAPQPPAGPVPEA